MPVCIVAVLLVARPSFLFGGAGLRPLGVIVAALQVLRSSHGQHVFNAQCNSPLHTLQAALPANLQVCGL